MFSPIEVNANTDTCYGLNSAWQLSRAFSDRLGRDVKVSSQEFIDCSYGPPNDNNGYHGGFPENCYLYATGKHLCTAGTYVYADKEEPINCKSKQCTKIEGVKVTGCRKTKQKMKEVKKALAAMGPLVVRTSWNNELAAYKRRTAKEKPRPYTGPCSSREADASHALLLAGYLEITGDDNAQVEVWKLLNSHGSDYGYDGYLYLPTEGTGNKCGVINHATFAFVEDAQKEKETEGKEETRWNGEVEFDGEGEMSWGKECICKEWELNYSDRMPIGWQGKVALKRAITILYEKCLTSIPAKNQRPMPGYCPPAKECKKDARDLKEPSARILPILCHDSHNSLFVMCGRKRSSLETWRYDLNEGTWSMLEDNVGIDETVWISANHGTCAVSPAANAHCEACQRPRIVHFSDKTKISVLELRNEVSPTSTAGQLRFYDRHLKLSAKIETLEEESWMELPMVARDPHTFYQMALDGVYPDIFRINIFELSDHEQSGGDWVWKWINETPIEYWINQPAPVKRFLDGHYLSLMGEGPYVHGDKLYIFDHDITWRQRYVDFRKVLVIGLDDMSLELLDTFPDAKVEAIDKLACESAAISLNAKKEVEQDEGEENCIASSPGYPPDRVHFASVIVDGHLYVLGGTTITSNYAPRADVWRLSLIDSAGDSKQRLRWKKLEAALELPVYQASAVHHNGVIYVFGGIIPSGWNAGDLTNRLQKVRIE